MVNNDKTSKQIKDFPVDPYIKKLKYEVALENYFFQEVRRVGAFALKINPVNNAGIPDVFVFHKSNFWAVELKTEKGQLRTVQKIFHGLMSKHGHDVRVLYGKDEVDIFITEIEKL